LPNVDARIARAPTADQLEAVVDAVVAQLGQVNWGPRGEKK
jgi:hypothetical protein